MRRAVKTRSSLGSPRGSLALAQAARATALFQTGDFAIPDDIVSNLLPVCVHRVIPAGFANEDASAVLERVGSRAFPLRPRPCLAPSKGTHATHRPIDSNGSREDRACATSRSNCACGLSKTFPLCDGSHKTTSKLEQPDRLYEYDPATLAVIRDVPDNEPNTQAG